MVKREIFFAGCNGFGTIYVMSGYANGADDFAPGQKIFFFPYSHNDFLGIDVEANGPYYKVTRFKQSVGTHRLELGTGNSLSTRIQGFVGQTREEACSKLTIALQC